MSVAIAVLSQKGGTGKTTLVRTLTDVFERLGLDVLAVDADPQGNLSDYFDTDPGAEPTLGDVLQGQARAADAAHGRVIPANLRLAEAELALAGKIGREVTLRNALRDQRRNRDLILIDCPPTLGLLTVNALVASTHAILCTEAQYFSLQGMEQAVEVLNLARDSLNPELELLGVCLNIANMRTRHARQTQDSLKARFGDRLFRTVIRQSIAYAESAERAIPILDYRPDRGADYLSLAGEILRRLAMPQLLERLDELSAEIVPGGPERRPRPLAAAAEPSGDGEGTGGDTAEREVPAAGAENAETPEPTTPAGPATPAEPATPVEPSAPAHPAALSEPEPEPQPLAGRDVKR
jgi:chromosome partitioning protein